MEKYGRDKAIINFFRHIPNSNLLPVSGNLQMKEFRTQREESLIFWMLHFTKSFEHCQAAQVHIHIHVHLYRYNSCTFVIPLSFSQNDNTYEQHYWKIEVFLSLYFETHYKGSLVYYSYNLNSQTGKLGVELQRKEYSRLDSRENILSSWEFIAQKGRKRDRHKIIFGWMIYQATWVKTILRTHTNNLIL